MERKKGSLSLGAQRFDGRLRCERLRPREGDEIEDVEKTGGSSCARCAARRTVWTELFGNGHIPNVVLACHVLHGQKRRESQQTKHQ